MIIIYWKRNIEWLQVSLQPSSWHAFPCPFEDDTISLQLYLCLHRHGKSDVLQKVLLLLMEDVLN